MKSIRLTDDLARAVQRYEIARAQFVPGRDPGSDIELPLQAVGEAALAALAAVKTKPLKVHEAYRQRRKAAS